MVTITSLYGAVEQRMVEISSSRMRKSRFMLERNAVRNRYSWNLGIILCANGAMNRNT